MIPKKYRLTKKSEFDLVLKHGRWFKAPHFSIKTLNRKSNPAPIEGNKFVDNDEKSLKIAVSIGVKYSKKAVERNRLRRRVFREMEEYVLKNKIKKGFYMLIVPAAGLSAGMEKEGNEIYSNISEEIELLLKKADVYQE